MKKDRSTIKDKDKGSGRAFASLENAEESDDDDDEISYEGGIGNEGLPRSFSSPALSKVLGQTPPTSVRQVGKPLDSSSSNSSFNSMSASGSSGPSVPRKIMRAVFDFSGSSDELSFSAGDEIAVLSEPKGGWSMGELSGRRGLFPIDYAEEVAVFRGRAPPPPLAPMPPRMTSIAQRALTDTTSEDGISVISDDIHDTGPDIRLYDQPFGDHHLAMTPLAAEHGHEQEPSTEMTVEDEDDRRGLFGADQDSSMLDGTSSPSAAVARFTSRGVEIGNAEGNSIPGGGGGGGGSARQPPAVPQRKPSVKKPPPPPPARRPTVSASVSPPSVSAASSTVPFPPPPVASKRALSRSRSSNPIVPVTPPDTISPFDN